MTYRHFFASGVYPLFFLVYGLLPLQARTPPTDSLRVLFLGNSYTFYNDLPDVLSQVAATAPNPVRISTHMYAEPGYTLEDHWKDGKTIESIRTNQWDVVVLQEQSTRPVEDRERMYRAVRLLDWSIRELHPQMMLFMTWSRENRPEMIYSLADAYDTLGESLGVPVAPVGRAWARARAERPDLGLYMPDQSHPNPTGTYLTAYVFYAALTQRDPRELADADQGSLTPEDAAFLQQIAWETVLQPD